MKAALPGQPQRDRQVAIDARTRQLARPGDLLLQRRFRFGITRSAHRFAGGLERVFPFDERVLVGRPDHLIQQRRITQLPLEVLGDRDQSVRVTLRRRRVGTNRLGHLLPAGEVLLDGRFLFVRQLRDALGVPGPGSVEKRIA